MVSKLFSGFLSSGFSTLALSSSLEALCLPQAGPQGWKARRAAVHEAALSYAGLLQDCSNLADGKSLHSRIVETGLGADPFLGNHLVIMYGRCGSLADAQLVFRQLRRRNVFSWTVMIFNYVDYGRFHDALTLYRQMQLQGISPNRITFINILKHCTNLVTGRFIHANVLETGLEADVVLGSTLVNMYGKYGSLEEARQAFEVIQDKNVVSWTAMLTAYVEHREFREALLCFRRMHLESDPRPNAVTVSTIVEACGELRCIHEARTIHSLAVEAGFDRETVVATALIDMYGKCGSLVEARKLFRGVKDRDLVCWSCMVAACSGSIEGISVLRTMLLEGVAPDKVTFLSAVEACCGVARTSKEVQILEACIAEAGLTSDLPISSALINMYAKQGFLEDCYRALEGIRHFADPLPWSTLVATHVEQGQHREAVKLFRVMLHEGVGVQQETFIAVLNACTGLAELRLGKLVHAWMTEWLDGSSKVLDIAASTALVSLYGRCGSVELARRIFSGMPELDVVSWNAMLGVYAEHGKPDKCRELFREMQQRWDEPPDENTFVKLLASYGRGGLVEEAWQELVSMRDDYQVEPMVEHLDCVVDMLGRSGQLTEAQEVIRRMPFQPNSVTWMSLLSACGTHNHFGEGKSVAQHLLDTDKTSAYVVLSNMVSAQE